MAYIEPCCCERQLPSELNGGFTFFQTNGDVLISHFLKSVSYLAGDSHVLVISLPEIDLDLLRMLKHYFDRGWTRAALLLSANPADQDTIETELAEHLGKVHYASDPLILDGMLAIVGKEKAVIIQGALLTKQDFSLSHYAAWVGRDKAVLQSAIDPLIAKLKTKARIDHHDNEDISTILNRNFL